MFTTESGLVVFSAAEPVASGGPVHRFSQTQRCSKPLNSLCCFRAARNPPSAWGGGNNLKLFCFIPSQWTDS